MAISQPESFGALLKHWRIAAGLTQEELAERAGLSARGISDLERGIHLPQRATIRLLAESLGIGESTAAILERVARGTFEPASTESTGTGVGSSPPLIGRTAELTVLDGHLAGTSVPLMVLGGEPGIGKSRLLYEAEQLGKARGLTVLSGGCQRRSAQEPYAPIAQALAAQVARMSPRQLQSGLQGCSWLTHLLPELPQLVRQPWPTEVTDSEQARRLMFGAVVSFLANLAGPVGTLLLLDDLQWAGTDALDLLAVLVRAAAEIRLRVVAAYRTTEADAAHPLFALIADLAKEQLLLSLPIDPLATEDAWRLLTALVGEQESDVLTERIVQRAGGVPFFLVSWAHGFQADGRSDAASDRVPWTLAQSIRQRVAALPLEGQVLLGIAAVIGREVSYPILLAASEQPEPEILIGLDAARQARLLTEAGGGAYRFAHDVVREVIEADLGGARRMLFHRRIGAAMEQRPEREREQRVVELAWHFQQGNEPERALPYALLAGDQATARFAHDEAEEQYRMALRLAREVNDWSYEAQALEKVGALYWTLGCHDEALSELEQAMDRYEGLADLDAVSRVAGKIGWTHSHRGALTEGLARLESLTARLEGIGATRGHVDFYDALFHLYLEHGMHRELAPVAERAAAAARIVGDDDLLVRGELSRGLALYWQARFDEALPVLADVRRRAEELGDFVTLFRALAWTMNIYLWTGAFEEAKAVAERAVTVTERAVSPNFHVTALERLVEVLFHLGDWNGAQVCAERALSVAPEASSWSAGDVHLGLASLALARGSWDDASTHLDAADAIYQRTGKQGARPEVQSLLAQQDLWHGRPAAAVARLEPLREAFQLRHDERQVLAEALVEVGDQRRAAALVEEGIEQVRAEKRHIDLVGWLRLKGMIQRRAGRWDESQAAFEEALSLVNTMPYPYGGARVLYELGLLQVEREDLLEARGRLEQALAIFRRLGAQPSIDRTEQALAELA